MTILDIRHALKKCSKRDYEGETSSMTRLRVVMDEMGVNEDIRQGHSAVMQQLKEFSVKRTHNAVMHKMKRVHSEKKGQVKKGWAKRTHLVKY